MKMKKCNSFVWKILEEGYVIFKWTLYWCYNTTLTKIVSLEFLKKIILFMCKDWRFLKVFFSEKNNLGINDSLSKL